MRLFLIVALASLAADAQTVDPNPPWSYDPIEVGNARSYALDAVGPVRYSRTDSPASITVDGHRWVIRRTQQFRRDTVLRNEVWSRDESRVLVRYDSAAANVVVRNLRGGERMLYPCRLDLPVPPAGESAPCGGGASYRVNLEADVEVGGRVVRTAVRSFDGAILGPRLAAGIGNIGAQDLRLAGAVVGGDTLFTEPPPFPSSRPDPVAGWRYVPFADGNEWQYESGRVGPGGARIVEEVLWYRMGSLTSVADHLFHTLSTSVCSPEMEGCIGLLEERYVRYDTLSGYTAGPLGVESRYGDVPTRFRSPCPFDEPVNLPGAADPVFCSVAGGVGVTAVSFGGRTETEAGVPVESESFKVFLSVDLSQGGPPAPVYAADIGSLASSMAAPITYEGLSYARLVQPNGSVLEVGRRYAVSADDALEPETFALEVGPNPTSGSLSVALEAATPSVVTLEVFDVLGRQVHVLEVAVAGRTQVDLDASRWATGLYVVRARSGLEVETATVVRR